MFRNSLLLFILILHQNMLTNCEMFRRNASECGASFYSDKIPENCQPKVCGIRTWTIPESEKFLKESQTLTSLIFNKGIIPNR